MDEKSAMDLINEARARVQNLSVEETEEWLGEGAMLIDIREAIEIEECGQIPGSIHMPRGSLEFFADPALPYHRRELDKDRPMVLYCAIGGRSALAADLLQTMGYRRVSHLDGGIEAWEAAGRAVEKPPEKDCSG